MLAAHIWYQIYSLAKDVDNTLVFTSMKLFNILFEAFTFEPRDLDLFIQNLTKRLKTTEAKMQGFADELNFKTDDVSEKEDKEYYFNKILNIATDYKYDMENIAYGLRQLKNAFKPYNQDIVDNINELYGFVKTSTNKYDKFNMLSYIIKALQRFVEDLEEGNPYMEKFAAADYSEGLESYREFFASDITSTVKQIAKEYLDIQSHIKDYVLPKLERLMLRKHAQRDEDLEHKTLEKIETLYHATINADQLLVTGFKQDFKQKVEGLGGSNLDKAGNPAISFTADLYVAKEIARCLKEAIMIAKGQLDIYDIKTMAMQAGVDKEIDEAFPNFSKPENLENLKPKDVFEYYRYYLMYSKRYDPVFFDSAGLMDLFKTKNVEDVGVLVCKVDMTDPNIKYLASMEEFRIAPKNIISIEKILR